MDHTLTPPKLDLVGESFGRVIPNPLVVIDDHVHELADLVHLRHLGHAPVPLVRQLVLGVGDAKVVEELLGLEKGHSAVLLAAAFAGPIGGCAYVGLGLVLEGEGDTGHGEAQVELLRIDGVWGHGLDGVDEGVAVVLSLESWVVQWCGTEDHVFPMSIFFFFVDGILRKC